MTTPAKAAAKRRAAALRKCKLARARAIRADQAARRRHKKRAPRRLARCTGRRVSKPPKRVGGATSAPPPTQTTTSPPPTQSTSSPPPPPPPQLSGTPSWVGDFETGDLSQWDGLNGNVAAGFYNVLSAPAPVLQGNHSLRAVVDQNSVVGGQAGQRTLAYLFPSNVPSQSKSGAFEGNEQWYHTSLYFPQDFRPSPSTSWNWVVEWHNWPNSVCCANLAMSVDTRGGGEALSLRVMGGGSPTYPVEAYDVNTGRNPAGHSDWFVGDPALKRAHWYDVLVHVKWSSDPAQGIVEWWLDNQLIFSRHTSTLFYYADNNENFTGASPGSGQAYFMEGYYRPTTLPNGTTDTSSTSVVHDGARRGPTRDSVG